MSVSADFQEAQRFIAGGVNSPVRAFQGIGVDPLFIERGDGKYLYDVDGNKYVDFCLSWGALILGHGHPAVMEAVSAAVQRGTSFGTVTRLETALARRICGCMPSIERLRFVNSGTEAVMTAVRLARVFTGRNTLLKFDGCYHGHSDGMLVSAGSGVAGLPAASSAGVPADIIRHTISIPFNDPAAAEKTIEENRAGLAAVIIEPVAANMGLVLPADGYLEALRALTRRYGIVLIFDEVITGFRLGAGGAQERFGVYPDLTTLGKIIGGGFPVGAVGGRRDIMKLLAPNGPVYQAGTLSGNPVAMNAGIATLDYLVAHRELYDRLENMVRAFAEEWRRTSPLTINAIGSMFTIFQTSRPVRSFADAQSQDESAFAAWYRAKLAQGIYLPPSRFETAFVSACHDAGDLHSLLEAV